MTISRKPPRQKTCENPACGNKFTPARMGQKVCGPSCALAIALARRDVAAKAIQAQEKKAHREAKERVKRKSDYAKDAQAAFNAWVRIRDRDAPCISCGRHHEGKYDAGHYRSVGSSPALRFEPLNCHKQCVPCNRYKSGNAIDYRIGLIAKMGADAVEWLEGPHDPKRYTEDDFKAIAARYRKLAKELIASRE